MKSSIVIAALVLALVACGTSKPNTTAVREQAIGSVQITYDGDGNWIKIVSSGVAPMNDKSTYAVSEATKVAAMHAKQNIAEFLSSDVRTEKTANIESTSTVLSKSGTDATDNDMTTLTNVIEHIKDNSAAILRGVQITDQTLSSDYARVEVTVTKQSVAASQSIQSTMTGFVK